MLLRKKKNNRTQHWQKENFDSWISVLKFIKATDANIKKTNKT